MKDSKRSRGASPEDADHQLDKALEDTFPASDPVSVEEPGRHDDAVDEARTGGRDPLQDAPS